jgi:excisionase family DNA binding protein
MTPPADLITVQEAGALLGITANSVRYYARRGELPGVIRVGKAFRFVRAELVAFLAALPTARFELRKGGLSPRDPRKGKPKSKEELRKRAATRGARVQALQWERDWWWGERREAHASEKWGADRVAAFRGIFSVLRARVRALEIRRRTGPLPLP